MRRDVINYEALASPEHVQNTHLTRVFESQELLSAARPRHGRGTSVSRLVEVARTSLGAGGRCRSKRPRRADVGLRVIVALHDLMRTVCDSVDHEAGQLVDDPLS